MTVFEVVVRNELTGATTKLWIRAELEAEAQIEATRIAFHELGWRKCTAQVPTAVKKERTR